MADTFATYAAKLDKLNRAMSGPDKEKLLHEVGKTAKDSTDRALEGDIGDQSMSHWRRGNPFDLTPEYKLQGEDVVEVRPRPKHRGPWRVMEDGRKSGSASDLVQVGRKRKDGTRRAKSRGRNQGATQGRATWSDATEIMGRDVPKTIAEEHVKALQVFR